MTVTAVGMAGSRERAPDHRDPVHRISQLLDRGSLQVIHQRADAGVVVARGQINGSPVIVYCTDATASGGAIGVRERPLIVDAIDSVRAERCPVIGIWHSGGATPALTDIVIMSDGGRVFVTGPDVVRSVTGEQIDMNGLGGPQTHGRMSGVAHLVADSEETALLRARDVELQQKWAANIVMGLGRIGGRAVGVIANKEWDGVSSGAARSSCMPSPKRWSLA